MLYLVQDTYPVMVSVNQDIDLAQTISIPGIDYY
jgi:hypothetical protein